MGECRCYVAFFASFAVTAFCCYYLAIMLSSRPRLFLFGVYLLCFCAFACQKTGGPVAGESSIQFIDEKKNPYTFLQVDGRVAVRTIPGISLFAPLPNAQQWFSFREGAGVVAAERMRGGADIVNFHLAEFFSPDSVGVTREIVVAVRANGLKTNSTKVVQRSFPFIFDTALRCACAPSTSTCDPLQTKGTDMSRDSNAWQLRLREKDTAKPIRLPLFVSVGKSLHFSWEHQAPSVGIARADSHTTVTYCVQSQETMQPANCTATKDTTVLTHANQLFLCFKVRGKAAPPPAKQAILRVSQDGEVVARLAVSIQ